jgi:uncharacterized membrane protein
MLGQRLRKSRGPTVSSLKGFLKTTIVGGLLFLVPVILLGLLLRHAMVVASKLAQPIAQMFPAHDIAGVAIGTIFAALMLLVVAFVAGVFARTGPGRKLTHWVEESFLGNLPQYRVVTSMAEGLTQIEDADGLKPVLVEIDQGWQLGYALEEVQNGWNAVFIPQSPTPLSGNVLYVRTERLRPLDIGMPKAMALVKQLGAGSAEALKDTDLTTAPGR